MSRSDKTTPKYNLSPVELKLKLELSQAIFDICLTLCTTLAQGKDLDEMQVIRKSLKFHFFLYSGQQKRQELQIDR